MATRIPHVLVTGGSRGIGLAIAQLFAKNGYRCTLLARNQRTLQAALGSLQPFPITGAPTLAPTRPIKEKEILRPKYKDAIEELEAMASAYNKHGREPPKPKKPKVEPPAAAHPGSRHGYIVGDITSPRFWGTKESTDGQLVAQMPKPQSGNPYSSSIIDVLVNCAGTGQNQFFLLSSPSSIENLVHTNLTSMMNGTWFFLRHGYIRRIKRSSGEADPPSNTALQEGISSAVIINISSLLGLAGGYGAVAYASAKSGVIGFTRALASEYQSHSVRVNAIVPGYVDTDMTKTLKTEQLVQKIPLGRFGTPDEIAQAALFLAKNEYAHNCVLNLDGGLSAV